MDLRTATKAALQCVLANNNGREGQTVEDQHHIDIVLNDPQSAIESILYVNRMTMESFFSASLFTLRRDDIWDCTNQAACGSTMGTPDGFVLTSELSVLSMHIDASCNDAAETSASASTGGAI